MKIGIKDIVKGGPPIVGLTAYTAPLARTIDPLVDIVFVGDSLGMVVYGFENTLSVTLDMMIAHGAAVVRSVAHALVVVDMPVGTYEYSPADALKNAQRVIKETGCDCVKMEGGKDLAPTVKYLVDNGVPVMGHVGLMPQSIEKMGGYKIQGRNDDGAKAVMADAVAIAEAGAFSLVIEGTIEPVAQDITRAVPIPTIGIGASPTCDGQVLVVDDVLGTYAPFTPKFAKRFVELTPIIAEAVERYATEVRDRKFPGPEHCFWPKT